MKLRFLDEASAEAEAAAGWYESKQRGLGVDFHKALDEALDVIEVEPRRYGQLETIRTTREIRRIMLRRFPYYVAYEVEAEQVVVLAVVHSGRRPNYWRRRL